MSILTKAKDWMLQEAAKIWINNEYRRFGTMTKLEIDSQKRTIHVELDLKGETAPIKVDVGRYTLVEENGKTYLEMAEVSTSREWINLLLEEFVKQPRFAVPQGRIVKALL